MPFPQTARWTSRTLRQQQPNSQVRLLVVDDEEAGAEALVASLSLAGYDTQFALTGRTVIRALNTWMPQIALVDINMPGMDGFAVARLLRQDGQMQHIVIVAFTAQDESTVRTEGIAAGFDGYCQKGAAPKLLLSLLEKIIGTSR